MAEKEQDRSEQATPFKLQEAKKKGQVAKSMDVVSLAGLAALLAAVYAWGIEWFHQGANYFSVILSNSSAVRLSGDLSGVLLEQSVVAIVKLFSPFLMTLLIVGVLAHILQSGFIFSFFPLKPDFNRLNPAEGFKRLFSLKVLFELFKVLLKLTAVFFVTYFVIQSLMGELAAMMQIDPGAYPGLVIGFVVHLLMLLILCLVVITAIDWVFSRWYFAQQMRMSKREVKDEYKRREGDPHIKSKRKQLQQERLKSAAGMGNIGDSDVIITNPTHFAVAIKYDSTRYDGPYLVVKGSDKLAKKIIKLGKKHGVPIIRQPPLARALFSAGKIDEVVPEEYFARLAKILAYVYGYRSDLPEGYVVSW